MSEDAFLHLVDELVSNREQWSLFLIMGAFSDCYVRVCTHAKAFLLAEGNVDEAVPFTTMLLSLLIMCVAPK